MKKFLLIFLLSLFFPINVQASEIFGRISTNPKDDVVNIVKTEDAAMKEVAGEKITAEPEEGIKTNAISWLSRFLKKILEIIKMPIKFLQAIRE